MIKKKFIILIIICLFLFSFYSKTYAINVIETNSIYNAYNSMEHDVEMIKNWMSSNFSSYQDFRQYLIDEFGVTTNYHYFAMTDTYSASSSGNVAFYLLSGYGQDVVDTTYYGIPVQGFNSSGQHTNIVLHLGDNNYASTKNISFVNNTNATLTFFSGFYRFKIEYFFSSNSLTQEQIAENTENMYSSILNTEEFLTNTTDATNSTIDEATSAYNNVYDSEVAELNSDTGSGLFLSRIKQWYNTLTNGDGQSVTTLDFDFNFFGKTTHFSMSSDFTSNLLLKLCGGNTTTRNIIRNIIQSCYYLTFFLYFGRLYYDMIANILSANISGFRSGIHLMFL